MFEMGDKLFWQMREQTKLVKAAEEVGMNVEREAPRAKAELWRIHGAIDPQAYDPPNLTAQAKTQRKRRRMPKLPEGRPELWG